MSDFSKPAKEFADLPIVQTQLRTASEFVGRSAALKFLESMDGCMRHVTSLKFDSPLELLFWVWWSACERGNQFFPYDELGLEMHAPVDAMGARYVLDFVISLREHTWQKARAAGALVWPKIAVELDGHAFHERTPEQVAKRDSRDRNLQQAGWTVFHYSWAEFTKEPERCVTEVYDLATTTAVELYRQYTQEVPTHLRGDE